MALRRIGQGLTPAGVVKSEKKWVLYVEDDDSNWEIANLALRDYYVMYRAKDSDSAIRQLEQHLFCVILMDIELAGSTYNGIELTKRIRAAPHDPYCSGLVNANAMTPVVFVTAYGARYSRDELLRVGASEVIEKPVDFARLSRVITKLTLRETMDILNRLGQ